MPASKRAKLILLLASTAASLLLVEAALRIAGVSHPNFYQPDPVRGWELRPEARGWWRNEGNAWVPINSDGMRDEEHPAAKPPGEVRIAVLGDSCAEALQVPAEKTFWSLLEKELARCPAVSGRKRPGPRLRRLGVWHGPGAAHPAASGLEVRPRPGPPGLLHRQRRAEQLPPPGARPGAALISSRGPDGRWRSTTPSARPRLQVPADRRGRLVYWAFDHSRLLQLGKQAKTAVDGWIGRLAGEPGAGAAGGGPRARARQRRLRAARRSASGPAPGRPPRPSCEPPATRRRRTGPPSPSSRLTTGMQVHPDPAVRQAFMKKLGVGTLFYPDERLAAFGQRGRDPGARPSRRRSSGSPSGRRSSSTASRIPRRARGTGTSGATPPPPGRWPDGSAACSRSETRGPLPDVSSQAVKPMRRFKPIHGVFLVLLFVGAVLTADLALEGRLGARGFERVSPGRDGMVRISLAGLEPQQVRFYQFLNAGNQEVRFFVGRDPAGHLAGRLRRQRGLRQDEAGLPRRGGVAGLQQVRQVLPARGGQRRRRRVQARAAGAPGGRRRAGDRRGRHPRRAGGCSASLLCLPGANWRGISALTAPPAMVYLRAVRKG